MKTVKTTLLVMLTLLTLACGYSSKSAPVAGVMPTIMQLSPDSVKAGGARFVLTVNGSNFATQAVVNWNGTAQPTTTYVSGNQLMVGIPAALVADPGTVQITVTNPGTPGSGMYGSGSTAAETSSPMSLVIN